MWNSTTLWGFLPHYIWIGVSCRCKLDWAAWIRMCTPVRFILWQGGPVVCVLVIHTISKSLSGNTVRFIWGQDVSWMVLETALLYLLLLYGCDYSLQPCMNDSSFWKGKVVISDTHSHVWLVSSRQELLNTGSRVHTHTMWLTLLFTIQFCLHGTVGEAI